MAVRALCVRLFQDRELIITRTFSRTVRCGARGWRFTNEDFTFRDDAEFAPALRVADYRLLTEDREPLRDAGRLLGCIPTISAGRTGASDRRRRW